MSVYDFLAGAGSDAHTVEQLFSGDFPVATQDITVISGQNLAIHTLVGRIAASGKITAWAPAANDGSEVICGIMTVAVDATAADKAGVMYVSGCFNPDMLVFPAGKTVVDANADLAGKAIILRGLTYSVG